MANISDVQGTFTVLTEHSPEDLTAFFKENQYNHYGALQPTEINLFLGEQVYSKTPIDFVTNGRWSMEHTSSFILDIEEDDHLSSQIKEALDGMTVEINFKEYETGAGFACEGFIVVKAIYNEHKDRLETEVIEFEENHLPFDAKTLADEFNLDDAWDTFTDYGRLVLIDHMIEDERMPKEIKQFLESMNENDETERQKFFDSVFDEDIKGVYDVYHIDFILDNIESMKKYVSKERL